MRRVILGTAGHIDHGKTTLVKALTGTDTDRLPEEKSRGITIDLGFAHLQLGELDIGIVDVPGHEGLIRNMLAGATGFDAVLLVIAADEGIMPQTREHFAIAELLGIQRLMVALTKADTVEPEWLALVRAEVQEFLDASAFPGAPIVTVSAVTNSGIDALRTLLTDELGKSAQRQDRDVFRMPIDRVFTVRGTGTVVTGTIWSGRAARDEIAHILPGDVTARIRGVQTHGAQVDTAVAGERAAFALVGVERDVLARGDALVAGHGWQPTTRLTARIQLLENIAFKQRQRVRVHLGTSEVMARVVLLDGVWVQLRLEQPIVARAGDRFIIRSYSPVATVAGGVVVEAGRIRKRVTPAEVRLFTDVVEGDSLRRVQAAVALAGVDGCAIDALPVLAGVSPDEAAMAIATLQKNDVGVAGSKCYARTVLEDAAERLVAAVNAYHAEHPLKPGMERAELLGIRLPGELAQAAMELAEARGHLLKRGSVVAAAGFAPNFSPKQQALRDQLLAKLKTGGLAPPTVPELVQSLSSSDVRQVLRLLEGEGAVTPVAMDLYLDSETLARAVRELRHTLGAKRLPAADFRTVLPVSRKYLIPLLEYLDRVGVTRREGDLRWVEPLETV